MSTYAGRANASKNARLPIEIYDSISSTPFVVFDAATIHNGVHFIHQLLELNAIG